MVTEYKKPIVEIDFDLVEQKYLFGLHIGKDAAVLKVPYGDLGEGGDPEAWKNLILFGWHIRGAYNDKAKEPEGQPPSPA